MAALNQIVAQNYPSALHARGLERIRLIGLAFDGKRVQLESAIWTPKGLEATTCATPTGPKNEASAEAFERDQLARRIQNRQRHMGLPETPLEVLLSKEATTLSAIIQALGLE